MKCILLAGGSGDRLWPLSRKNLPKQFMQIQGNHSIFQETIARNMPFCDEFVIVTNRDYQFIANGQVDSFQGLVHRFVLEGTGRKTTAAITLACLNMSLSEMVMVAPSDQIIEGNAYKQDLMRAKELCEEGYIVALGIPGDKPEERFGYIQASGEEVIHFVEKPDRSAAEAYLKSDDYLINSGMFLFRVGDFLRELRLYAPMVLSACEQAFRMKKMIGGGAEYAVEVMNSIPALSVEKAVFEKTEQMKVVKAAFQWKDIGSLEDLKQTDLKTANEQRQIRYECTNTDIINQCERRIVVANNMDDTIIVNTKDVVYVGKKGKSNEIKTIIADNQQIEPFVEGCRVLYRQWGYYELLVDTPNYRVKKAVILPEKTIFAHKHIYRSEHWVIVSGEAMIDIDGKSDRYSTNAVIDVLPGMMHQVTNIHKEELILIEVSVGDNVSEDDKISLVSRELTDEQLGKAIEPMVMLSPVYKDYLWGGTKLKEIFGKKCDYDILAESWELSAHETGPSIVASGQHKGSSFPDYLNQIGKKSWGWKCQSMEAFPILIKFIDAHDSLSVQVHPDDDYALAVENQYGKNEMWYIVDCEPDSYLYCGFNKDVTREEVERRVKDDSILEILNQIPVGKGDVYFIPAGTVHAIGAGILICEIQQSSSCTYRLYDFARKDRFGNYRELHLEKALDVLNYRKYSPQKLSETEECGNGYVKRTISRCKYFECAKYDVPDGSVELQGTEESFMALTCLKGQGVIRVKDSDAYELCFQQGSCIFMPKADRIFVVEGMCEFIVTNV